MAIDPEGNKKSQARYGKFKVGNKEIDSVLGKSRNLTLEFG